MTIAIIGSGIAGLATAIRLAAKGHDVVVFEKNSRPGGKMAEIQNNGFRFDAGPSLLTMPELIADVFTAAGESLDLYDHFIKLDETCRYFYPDGSKLTAFANKEKFARECDRVFKEPPRRVKRYLAAAARLYRLTADIFLFSSLHRLKSYLKWSVLTSLLQLHRLKFYTNMHRENRRQFKSLQIVQLFDRYATYNGSSPYRAPATLNIIAHLEHNMGAWFPKRGMYSIIELLYELAQRKGATFRFNSKVEKILLESNEVQGVKVNGSIYEFDYVVSNSDAKYVAENLMHHPRAARLKKLESSSSALIFYWGVKGTFDELGVHNILFSSNYRQEFDAIFKQKTVYHDPTVYIFTSSKLVPGDAPDNSENWFVMINAPADAGQDWDSLINSAKKQIIEKIKSTLGIDIEKLIQSETIASPQTIEADTLSPGGALYGSSSNSMFSAFLRHPNFLRGIKKLAFVGGSVHPGGGIPLCLAGAKIVSDDIPGA